MKKLNEMSVVELKSYAYDLLAIIERAQADFKIVNDEILKRDTESKKPEKEEKSKK